MNTNYDNEATQYQGADNEATQYQDADNKATQDQGADNEATQHEESSTAQQINQDETSDNAAEVTAAKEKGWKRVAVSAGSGLLIGSVATVLMGMKSADTEPTVGKQEINNHNDEPSHPEWTDGQIQVATSVNDDMSFGEAFAAARAEVGPGGCFEWHGNVYGTYTADEWNHMTAEQRAEWSDHFSWNHIDHSSSNVAQHSTTAHTGHSAHTQTTVATDDVEVVSVNHENGQNDVAQNSNNTGQSGNQTHVTASDDDIDIVSVNHENNHTGDNHHTGQPGNQTEVVEVSHVEGPTGDAEIEILGVVHDNETGANIGGMMVDNQEVILIDVDGDLAFDYMASDFNHNGEVEENEVVDIQDQHLTVSDLGGFTDSTGDMIASNDAPDYSSDIYEG